MSKQIVVFDLGSEQFGVDIELVESIIKIQEITRMPHTPSFVEGVTNLRGKVIPVIDLHKRFEVDLEGMDKRSRIIIVSINQVEVGMIVDEVSEVLTIPDQAIEPPPAIALTVRSQFISGIVKLEGRLVILLDMDKVLSTQEQSVLAQS